MKKIHVIYLILNMFLLTEAKGQGLSANDILIAKDSIHSVEYDEQAVWTLRRVLMSKLLSDTILISQDSSVAAFYDTFKNTNIEWMSKVRLTMDTLYNMDSLVTVEIQNNMDLITAAITNIAQNDSVLSNDTTLSEAEITELQEQNSLLYTPYIITGVYANDSIYSVIRSALMAKAEAIKSINDTLAGSTIYEQNEIDVNNIYLSTIAAGYPDSIANYSTQLYNIAKQCLMSGGPAVSYARSIYHAINDSIQFNDDQICESPSDTCLVPPAPGVISGRTDGVCGQQFIYSIDSMLNVNDYTWSVSFGAVIDSGQGTASVYISFSDTIGSTLISVYASNGCGAGSVRNLFINAKPVIALVSMPSAVCSFSTGIHFGIDSVAGNASTFSWFVPPGCTIDSGQGTADIYVSWDSLPGNVKALAYNTCGVSDTLNYPVAVVACKLAEGLAISSGSTSDNVKLYPNPATGKVTVQYNLENNGLIQLFDVVGKEVRIYKLDSENNRFEFDITNLCCGIFEYRVISGDNLSGRGKLVIVR